MKPGDKDKVIQRYLERVKQFGHGPSALGEPKERQAFYFDELLRAEGFGAADSVLDVGCGYGDLESYLRTSGWSGRYTGVDINPALVEEGRRRHPGADLRVADLESDDLGAGSFDWCASFHVLTSDTDEMPFLDHLQQMVAAMWRLCRKGLVFNQLSPLVDYRNPVHARPPIGEVLQLVSKLTRRFAMRHDYMPYEYAICAYKDDAIDKELLVFRDQRARFDAVTGKWTEYKNRKPEPGSGG